MDEFWKYLPLAVAGLQLLLLWAQWSLKKQFVSRDSCETLCKKLGDKQRDLEAAHQAMPSAEDLEKIQDRLGGIEGEMKGMGATLKGQAETMVRIERPLNLLLEHHLRSEPR